MRTRAASALVVLATLSATAGAHPQFAPSGSNRYLKVTLLGGGALRVAYAVMVGEVPAHAARKIADENSDGIVGAKEQAQMADKMREAVDRGLTIEVDGRRRDVAWEKPVPGFSKDTRVGPIPFSVDVVGRIDVGTGEHKVRIDDETTVQDLLETEIFIEEGPGTKLLGGWQGREDAGRQNRFLFQGPKPSLLTDRSIGFRYVDNTARRRALPIALLGVFAGVLVAGVLVIRARSRRAKS